jgi:hypothetical protein
LRIPSPSARVAYSFPHGSGGNELSGRVAESFFEALSCFLGFFALLAGIWFLLSLERVPSGRRQG